MTIISDPTFDSWLCGYLAGHKGATVADAVAAWIEQDELAARFAAQR